MPLTLNETKRKHPLAECEICPLQSKLCAKSVIPKNPVAALVARSPGYHEAKTGVPFSGPSGKIIEFLLNEQGVDRKDMLLTNVVLCSPDEGKIPPEAIKACAPRLRAELADQKLVIAAGSEAVNLLIGRGSIDTYRGYRIQTDDRTLVATNNPFLVVRDDSAFPNLRKDFRRAFNPIPEPTLPTVKVFEDAAECRRLITFLRDSPGLVAADVESRGGLTHKATLVSMQFAVAPDEAFVIGERSGIFQDADFIEGFLRPFLESRDHVFLWHNGKYDIKILRHSYGINARVDEDSMLMSYACDERSGPTAKEHGGIHKLENLLAEEFGWPNYEPESVKNFKKTGIVTDYDELHEYAGRDAAGTYQLYELFSQRIADEGVTAPYKRLLLEGSEAFTRAELAGFTYDINAASDLMEEEIKPEFLIKTQNLKELIDDPLYNPRSPVRTAALFYDTWKINHEMRSRPDKNRSTDDAALGEILAGRFTHKNGEMTTIVAFAKELRRFRELTKQADTYITGMIEQAIKDEDQRIYTDLLLHGTTSGRPASRNPNLLNITRTKEGLPDIRKLFLPSKGRLLVVADYSQAELRTIAYLSQDKQLLKVYNEGLDLHSFSAERFYGANFTPENRSIAKNINFGVFYGQSADSFQEKHGIDKQRAQEYIDWCWKNYTGVAAWKNEVIKQMRTGRVVTPFGRVRRFHLLTKENYNSSVREAINFLPQSIAADFTLLAFIKLGGGLTVLPEIDVKRASLILTVYDSIIGDVEESYVDEFKAICKQVMESIPKDELGWTIPYVVDIGAGQTWADTK
jgi:DNA polymerase-1